MRAWPQLSFAAGIFVDRSLRLRPEFQYTAAAAHRALIRSMDGTRRDGLRDIVRVAVTEPDFVMRCLPRSEQVVSPCMVPKFKFSFDPLAADLSRMAVNAPPEVLFLSAMMQKFAVQVDEEGSTAVEAMYVREPCSPTYTLWRIK
ncbi:hypothetical protein E2562_029383 [Oryza meyeriana var. granulata]|uniref:Uncharacterized protein n=1 Tax=Oryza meyeriana var. granulata TaxID=110450 RepID=A0A6G1C290_9ORYZ|nr:hypothetical protein E2562_029383 [Oryza meyeriana var. granulata]